MLPTHDSEAVRPRVFIVDDEWIIAETLAEILEKNGFRAQAFHNPDRALVRALVQPPDIVLTDVMMPGMDGYATMTAIRRMPEFESLPIIAVTARAMPSDREKSLAAGANDYVTKPVDTDELMACMERWLASA